jgi:hypothetical protein
VVEVAQVILKTLFQHLEVQAVAVMVAATMAVELIFYLQQAQLILVVVVVVLLMALVHLQQ